MRTRDADKEELVKQRAIESIVKYGLEGFSMNKLAKACKISVGTLYIYYKDKDELILNIAAEEGIRMASEMLKDFDPNSSFEIGLRQQWKNRYEYMMANPFINVFFEQLRSSSYHEQFMETAKNALAPTLSKFMNNAREKGEIDDMPMEVYWSVAFSPLYSLVRFHHEGRGIGGYPFKMSDEMLWATFDRVLKALKN